MGQGEDVVVAKPRAEIQTYPSVVRQGKGRQEMSPGAEARQWKIGNLSTKEIATHSLGREKQSLNRLWRKEG